MAASVAGSLVVATRLTARKVIAAKRVTVAPSIRARAFRGASQIVMVSRVEKSDADWSKELDKTSFQVLRKKGTEPAGTGEYDKFYPTEGHFVCKGCGNPLYSAESKFNSGCGWYVVLDLLFSALDSSQVSLSEKCSQDETDARFLALRRPAFDKCYKGALITETDVTFGMKRVVRLDHFPSARSRSTMPWFARRTHTLSRSPPGNHVRCMRRSSRSRVRERRIHPDYGASLREQRQREIR